MIRVGIIMIDLLALYITIRVDIITIDVLAVYRYVLVDNPNSTAQRWKLWLV